MSGLRPVPRIPNRHSTMNGSDASATAASSIGSARRNAGPRSVTRGRAYAAATAATRPIVTAAVVPSPGSRTVHQASGQSAARPIAGASRDQRRRPQATAIAWPTSAEAPRQRSSAA